MNVLVPGVCNARRGVDPARCDSCCIGCPDVSCAIAKAAPTKAAESLPRTAWIEKKRAMTRSCRWNSAQTG